MKNKNSDAHSVSFSADLRSWQSTELFVLFESWPDYVPREQDLQATMRFAAAISLGDSTDMNVHPTVPCDFIANRL